MLCVELGLRKRKRFLKNYINKLSLQKKQKLKGKKKKVLKEDYLPKKHSKLGMLNPLSYTTENLTVNQFLFSFPHLKVFNCMFMYMYVILYSLLSYMKYNMYRNIWNISYIANH